MKYLKKFEELEIYEGLFDKKSKEELTGDLKPKGIMSTIPRPEWSVDKPEIKKMGGLEPRVDPYFLQEISDRLYGPDSEKYIDALMNLHSEKDENGEFLYKPRVGRYGSQFYDPESVSDKNIKRSK